jgi:hypothetical protein
MLAHGRRNGGPADFGVQHLEELAFTAPHMPGDGARSTAHQDDPGPWDRIGETHCPGACIERASLLETADARR